MTPDQLDLIKRTVANGATADELKLYLYDCARQGVHPLDKLIHFTKRSGKYTPITSIDFMRTRAADSGEYAGSDDARFESGVPGQPPLWATVKVYRLVQGQKCSFEATARWNEYVPEAGPSGKGDVMWKKMPHTMLAKCAEALALRKGFPRQLAGLYAKEEMDQAGQEVIVQAPAPVATIAQTQPEPVGPTVVVDVPEGAVLIKTVTAGRAGGKSLGGVILSTGEELPVYKQQVKDAAVRACQDGVPVVLDIKVSGTSGKPYLNELRRVDPAKVATSDDGPMLTDADIPF